MPARSTSRPTATTRRRPGAYEQRGDIATLTYPIDGRITDDGSSPFRAEAGRYHLYYSYYCPWAQRPMIALKLRGLDGVVTSSAVDPVRDGRGWAFREGRGHGPDPVNGFPLLRDAYLATDPAFAGHISVPALWDRATQPAGQQPLRDHDRRPRDPVRRLRRSRPSTCFPTRTATRSTPPTPRSCATLATAAYAAMAVGTQAQYDAVSDRVYAALDRFDARLADRRFLVGDAITDADLLLYVQLVRFDLVAVPLGRLTRRRLVDHPNLWAYARDLYQRPAFRETTDFDHIARGTFGTGAGIRTQPDRARDARSRLGRAPRPRRTRLTRPAPGAGRS